MLDPELSARLDEISLKADAAYQAAEKVRKYILWTGIVSVALFVLPVIGLIFVIPSFLSSYTSELGGATTDAGGSDSSAQMLNSLLGN